MIDPTEPGSIGRFLSLNYWRLQMTDRQGAVHDYLSTGCLHGDMVLPDGRTGHAYCQSDTGAAGTKTPAVCKFCGAPCRCDCHGEAS
ncbi:hypothetical protein [Kitasatospora kifunensis]|uniref:Uncharacterized protein n=1 Tax=Kitasatospora kifunensis TaxID=58351 RepID=A0A7W7QYJ8_KITKI|nr:hypothetical protein [Kitasatospora kifunensis]MBB4922180.1 hypothetical protein [Kitasatospora kifunensis]